MIEGSDVAFYVCKFVSCAYLKAGAKKKRHAPDEL